MHRIAAPTETATRELQRAADGCVKCGACLPVCPTYAHRRHEADSPRGRIGLTQGLLAGHLPADAALAAHLDGCLHCGLCEAVCPAQVPIVHVIQGGSSVLRSAGVPATWRTALGRHAARFAWVKAWVNAKATAWSGARRGPRDRSAPQLGRGA